MPPAELLAIVEHGRLDRIRKHGDASALDPPAHRNVREEPARDDDPRRATEGEIADGAEQRDLRATLPLEALDRHMGSPRRTARS